MKKKFIEKPIRKKRIYKGKVVDFWVDTIRLPSGAKATREYLGHSGAVAVIAVVGRPSKNPRILMVKQYRYPVNRVTLELPAGKLSKGENSLSCVKRELEEETGYKTGNVKKIISYWPTAAFSNEVIHIYVAQGLSAGKFNPDDDEFIEPVVVTLAEALGKVRSGGIKDSKTMIGLLAYDAWRGKK